MTDSSSEPTYSWAKRVNDNKGLFESAGAIAKQALESSQQVSAAGSAAEKGLTEKIHGGFAKARIAITAVDALCKAIFGYSPVDEWIKKPFFGDWDDLRATANQWRALAESLSALQSAVRNVSSNVDETSWSGKAADLFVIRNNSLAETAGKGPQRASKWRRRWRPWRMRSMERSTWSWTESNCLSNCWPRMPPNSAYRLWDRSSEPPKLRSMSGWRLTLP